MAENFSRFGSGGIEWNPDRLALTKTTGPQQNVTNTSGQTTSSQTTQSSGTQQTSARNMDPSSLAALQALISQLMGGGTQQMAEDRARRQQEIQALQNIRGQYSKEAAFGDAQGAMSQQLRQAMEASMPSLVRAAEGAGTSQNSMRALLTQDALNRAAEASSALGLQAAVQYGGLGANYSSVLEQLTRGDNTVTEALLNALNIAKGAVQDSTTQTSGTQTTTGVQNMNQIQTQNLGGRTDIQLGGGATGPAQQFNLAGGTIGGSKAPSVADQLSSAQWNALAKVAGGDANWFAQDKWANYLIPN